MKYNNEPLAYSKRLEKGFIIPLLIVTAIVIYVHFKNGDILDPRNILISSGLIFIVGLGLIITSHLTSKTYFHEVELTDENVILRGEKINQPKTIELPISDTKISIICKGHGRGNVECFVRFENESKRYDINRLFNWDYNQLVDLFYKYKEIQGEKIIWDERYPLEYMEKKAKGMSSFEIAFGKNK